MAARIGDGRLASRRVAVTGAGGFIGTHLVVHLVAAGAQVTVLGPTPLKRRTLRSLIERGQVDYKPFALEADRAGLAAALEGCDGLIHLRYRPPASGGFWPELLEDVNQNLLESIRLLDAAAEVGVGQVCLASSVSVYTPPALGVDEDAPVGGPLKPYALVKLQQEDCARQWSRRTGRPAAVLRLATVYGPGETVGRAIPNFIRAVLSGRKPVVAGRGASQFDPIYVADVAGAFVCSLEASAEGTFNIATGRGWPTRHVARLVMRLCGVDGDVVCNPAELDRDRPVCNVTRAKTVLGFKARTSLEVGLQAEIKWLRAMQLRRSA
ncbi:MAG TPA: NAD(P)-dependent oxidoreductase [Candidatus Dormibacteraeota bacterium]|nr:NAD(P)-dependent oxidoreductase [Candidatus Dormibacteraeota bacterium]